MSKPLTFRALRRKLREFDPLFEFRPGKGSENVLWHPWFRLTCVIARHGDGDVVSGPVLGKIVRNFSLPRGFFDPRSRKGATARPPTPLSS